MMRADDAPSYRRVAFEDVPRMNEIEQRCFATPWSVRSLEEELCDNPYALYWGAYRAGVLVGYVGVWIVMDEAHMTNLAVHPDHRRRGIAKTLLEDIKRMARRAGARSMTLEVRESNAAARRLYASMGFVDAGRRARYYADNNEDAIIMWCNDLRWHNADA
jgi:ribosomal-protein-alanine N-acetyltransferase